jgi:hypothetical protein
LNIDTKSNAETVKKGAVKNYMHCSVQEFSAAEGCMFAPAWVSNRDDVRAPSSDSILNINIFLGLTTAR